MIFSLVMLETTLFLCEWPQENMRLHVLINLQMLNWECSLRPLQLHLRQEIPQNLFCCQNTYNHYGNLPHLIDLFLLPASWIPSTLFMRQHFFHGPSLLNFTIISTCLSDFHLSVSGVAPVFPFRFIKSQLLQCALNLWSRTPISYEANRIWRAVNRLYLQSDW